MRKLIALLILVCVGWAGSVNAATITRAANGLMTGATSINVAGVLYDVEFLSGSCNSLFNDCTGFQFTTPESGETASLALYNQVLLEGFSDGAGSTIYTPRYGAPAGLFVTPGECCLDGIVDVTILIPFVSSDLSSGNPWGEPGTGAFLLQDDEIVSATNGISPYGAGSAAVPSVYVNWTLSAVPLPAAAWLFISAIAGLAGAKRLTRSKRTV